MTIGATIAASMGGSMSPPWLKRGDPYGRVFLADAATGLLASGFTYTRSGPDLWCPQADGSLASFAANVIPREYAGGRWGFRFDPGWTQSLKDTNDFTTASWIKTGVQVVDGDTTPGPFGTTVQAWAGSAGSSLKRLRQNLATTTLGPWYARWLIKPGTEDSADFVVQDSTASNGARVTVNLLTGALTSGPAAVGTATVIAATATVLPSGFVDVSIGVNFATALTQIQAIATWDLNGASATTGTLYPACANLTNTAYPVPLTVAQGTAVTVGNHSCSALLSALGISLGAEYTIGVEYTLANIASGYQPIALALSNNTAAESVYHNAATLTASREPNWVVNVASVNQASSTGLGPPSAVGQLRKTAIRIKANDFRASYGGVLSVQDTTGTLPTVDRLFVGSNWSGNAANAFQGHIHKLWIAPSRALTDTELQAVTA